MIQIWTWLEPVTQLSCQRSIQLSLEIAGLKPVMLLRWMSVCQHKSCIQT